MRILILGGAGFLGSHLVRRCLSLPSAEITVLDSLEFPTHQLPPNLASVWDRIEYIKGSIVNTKLVRKLVQDKDFIFHCAAQSSHTYSLLHPAKDAEVNLEGTLVLLEAIREFNSRAVIVYPSTTSVAGKMMNDCIDENYPCSPLDIYSIHKLTSEHYLRLYHLHYGLKTIILRFGNLFGPGAQMLPDYGFINFFIAQAFAGNAITIFGDGSQLRNVTFVEDAADLMISASASTRLFGRAFYATSLEHFTVIDIAQTICEVFGRGRVIHIPWPEIRKRIEIGSVRFSSVLLRSHIVWPASTSLRLGLKKTFDWLIAAQSKVSA